MDQKIDVHMPIQAHLQDYILRYLSLSEKKFIIQEELKRLRKDHQGSCR